jgi:hypothetical protein
LSGGRQFIDILVFIVGCLSPAIISGRPRSRRLVHPPRRLGCCVAVVIWTLLLHCTGE